jgi:hypothetical protein
MRTREVLLFLLLSVHGWALYFAVVLGYVSDDAIPWTTVKVFAAGTAGVCCGFALEVLADFIWGRRARRLWRLRQSSRRSVSA